MHGKEARNTRILQWAGARGALVHGVDISTPTLLMARREFARRGQRLGGVVADVRAIPFRDGAFDAAYSMAPYLMGPDDALVITGRWPECRCANVSLWNRHMQTFDYANRRVCLNRRQTRLEPDGSFRMVIAHRDPGVPNWIDTEGRAFGLVFWRFMLPEGEIETPQAEVVPFASIARD